MNLMQITSADLKRIGQLLAERETLQSQVQSILDQLTAYESGPRRPARLRAPSRPAARPTPSKPAPAKPAPAKPVPAKPAKVRRAKPGTLTTAILQLAQQAGNAGVTVKELTAKLGLGQNRVHNWLYATGKHIAELKKIGEAHYAWMPAALSPTPSPIPPQPPAKPVVPSQPAPAAPAAAPRKPAKARAAKPGQLKDSIIQLVKAAGKSGVTVREIAAELGLHPQRVYVWFNATAKNVPEIEKVGPAKYGWMD